MTLAVDASFLVAALVDSGPEGAWAERLLHGEDLVAPELVLAEGSNIFRRLELARQLSIYQASSANNALLRLNIELVPYAPFATRVWELRQNLTCYDAWYVALAEASDCPLATLDRRMRRAAGPLCRFIDPPAS